MASSDIEREWRYALRLRGIDFIDAIPLDPPEVAPPPPALTTLQDGNWRAAHEIAARLLARPRIEPAS